MTSLPRFDAPPVTEVVIATRFKRSTQYSLVSLGALTASLGAEGFSRIEEKPAYDAPVERFVQGPDPIGPSLELLTGPPPLRYWFLNEVGDELLQVQPNWFAANWRKVEPTARYGQWGERWDAFDRWLREFEKALGTGGLDHDQVEVTYINHIDPGRVWTRHGDAPSVFTPFADPRHAFLPGAEQSRAEFSYLIEDEPGNPAGRLHVSISPGFRRPTGTPIFVMNLTARGAPLGPAIEGVRAFAELAHEWIVRGFTELTTEAMHEEWKRTI